MDGPSSMYEKNKICIRCRTWSEETTRIPIHERSTLKVILEGQDVQVRIDCTGLSEDGPERRTFVKMIRNVLGRMYEAANFQTSWLTVNSSRSVCATELQIF
jgi:hypothetical protein